VKYVRIHVYEYTEQMFTSNLPYRDKILQYISKFQTKHTSDRKRWSLTPFPFLAPWPSRPPAIETTSSPWWVPHFMTKNASCPRIPPRASGHGAATMSDESPTTRCPFSLRPCSAPLSCSLHPLLKLLLLSLRPSLLQIVGAHGQLIRDSNGLSPGTNTNAQRIFLMSRLLRSSWYPVVSIYWSFPHSF